MINIITRSADQTQGVLASLAIGTLDRGIGSVRFGGTRGALSYRVFARGAFRGAAHHPGHTDFECPRIARWISMRGPSRRMSR